MPEQYDAPTFVDVAALLSGGVPDAPVPTLCERRDGHALFYLGEVNHVFGDPESGKTWIAAAAVAEALADSLRVLWIDADHNGAASIVARLMALGVSPDVLTDPGRFRIAEPEDRLHLSRIVDAGVRWSPDVAVVDSIGEVLPMLGLNSNSPDDFTTGNRLVLSRLARAGAAVIGVDHLPKSPDSRAAGPSGTLAKKRTVGGASYRVTIREPFAPGSGGAAALSIFKDRHGGVRAHSPVTHGQEQPAGIFVLTPVGEAVAWHVTEPSTSDVVTRSEIAARPAYRVTDEDLAEVDGLTDEDRESVRRVKSATRWGSDRATAVLAEWKRLRGVES